MTMNMQYSRYAIYICINKHHRIHNHQLRQSALYCFSKNTFIGQYLLLTNLFSCFFPLLLDQKSSHFLSLKPLFGLVLNTTTSRTIEQQATAKTAGGAPRSESAGVPCDEISSLYFNIEQRTSALQTCSNRYYF